MQTLRSFEILYILLQKRKATAKELAEHFEVSIRTIYRDLDVLTLAGIPIYTNKGKNGGIFLNEDYVLNRSCLNDEEQNKIIAALQSMQIIEKQDSSALLSKLSAIFQKPDTPWIQVDFSDWSDEHDKDIFQILKEAILKHQVVTFLYHDSYGHSRQRIVEPLQLLFKSQAWYLVAYCKEKEAQRTFKIKRMQHIQMTKESFERELEETSHHIRQYQSQQIDVILRMEKNLGYRIFEEFPRDHIEEHSDHFIITCRLPVGEMLYGILLSYGAGVSVVSPAAVKEGMKQHIKEMLKNYD